MIWKPLKKLLIVGMACLVTVLYVAWKTFHKNLLDVHYSSTFLFIVLFTSIYIHTCVYVYVCIYIYIYYIYYLKKTLDVTPNLKWSVVRCATPYSNISKKSLLCLYEKQDDTNF